ncbi:MAG: histidine kinase [Gammaproteobacteria bacterium HGW-Gammaproteobacteria-3]|nr:MAG: histidine kinase [Gammaproteobacteria bacterium HGW-Gammaproteobacteria-3]
MIPKTTRFLRLCLVLLGVSGLAFCLKLDAANTLLNPESVGKLSIGSYTLGFTTLFFIAFSLWLAISINKSRRLAQTELQQRNTALALEIQQRKHDALKYRGLVESARVIVWSADPATFQLTYVSKEAETLLGYPLASWTSEPDFWPRHIHPDDREWAVSYCLTETTAHREHKFEYRMMAADGRIVWLYDIVEPIIEDGKLKELVGVMVDITERKQVEAAFANRTGELTLQNRVLRNINQKMTLDQVLDTLTRQIEALHPEMICSVLLLDAHNKLRHGAAPSLPDAYNRAIDGLAIGIGAGSCGTAAFLGERVIVADIKIHPLWSSYQDIARNANIQACWSQPIKNSTGQVLGTFAIYHRQPTLPTDSEILLIERYAELALLAIEHDRAEATIRNLAYYDPLTQLPNRRLLMERLRHGLAMARRDNNPLALLMLDLDYFKAVNDSLGHLAGDDLLQQVAARIKTRLRSADTIARLGGDEFVVLLEDMAHQEDAARVAKSLVTDLEQAFCIGQRDDVRISVSIGISLYPQHAHTPEQLMDQADAALYQAKDAGRGCFAYYSEAMTQAVRERIELEARLRKAIEQQELRVHYQAQAAIASGRIIGAEALVRWQDADGKTIAPGEFIPIAETSGLIVALGEWVLAETCRQGRRWLDAGLPPLTLAVNVSPHQFRSSDMSALVARILEKTGFPAEHLELELTESGLMDNQTKVMEILNDLRAQGIRLAIDDFGTGYSSLAYLKRFPVNVLKIDKTFIDDIPHSQYDMEITSTIIAMGRTLGFKVLAEGVETAEQLAFLKAKGCDYYQGYFKCKPVPGDIFAELLRQQQVGGDNVCPPDKPAATYLPATQQAG